MNGPGVLNGPSKSASTTLSMNSERAPTLAATEKTVPVKSVGSGDGTGSVGALVPFVGSEVAIEGEDMDAFVGTEVTVVLEGAAVVDKANVAEDVGLDVTGINVVIGAGTGKKVVGSSIGSVGAETGAGVLVSGSA